MEVIAVIAGSLVAWSLISQRAERLNLSAPIAFVAVGMAVTHGPLAFLHVSLGTVGVREIAEITLAVVLFGDAGTVDLRKLRRDAVLPSRLLIVGLPLTMGLGAVAAHWLLGTSWWVSALIGAAVAPTDAALGAAIIEDERVPAKVRRILNVESGLNDGIATPFVNFFLAAAIVGTSLETASEGQALVELAVGVAGGVLIGGLGGWAMSSASAKGWSTPGFRAIGTASLSILAYAGMVHLGGNGFVAAFVAGLAYSGATAATRAKAELGFTHDAGHVLSLTVWFLFGALAIPVLRQARWTDVAFAVAALTIIRMGPVALSLIGSGFDRATVGVVGWFGPRGLASVVFALVAAEGLAPADGRRALTVITVTVLLSVVAHGISAAPVARGYSALTHANT